MTADSTITADPLIVNGREYPMWGQFIARKAEWIGGTLIDTEGVARMSTRILDIELVPNGETSAFFRVVGQDFACGFDVKYGGVTGRTPEGFDLGFQGYGGHTWGIVKPKSEVAL